jgi:hypothetical protein
MSFGQRFVGGAVRLKFGIHGGLSIIHQRRFGSDKVLAVIRKALAPLPGSRLKGDGRSRALVELTPSPRGSFLMRGHLRRRVSRGVGRVAELSFLYPGT